MPDLDALYGELTGYIQELGVKFVDKFIPADPATRPADYAHDVRAYCVLCHAAFEDYMETVVLAVASHAVDQWTIVTPRKINDVIPALLSWNGAKMKIDDDENSSERKPFDYLRPLILEAKRAFSREVSKNHGVSILYLRNLLTPVAIEINADPSLLNALKKLSDGRGNYAHKGKVKNVLVPEDAKKHVQDVLTICDDVRVKALANMT